MSFLSLLSRAFSLSSSKSKTHDGRTTESDRGLNAVHWFHSTPFTEVSRLTNEHIAECDESTNTENVRQIISSRHWITLKLTDTVQQSKSECSWFPTKSAMGVDFTAGANF